MSDNPLNLRISFADESSAENSRRIIQDAQTWIYRDTGEERYLGDYISMKGLGEGINFDSYWVPSGDIDRQDTSIKFELVGSPGDDFPGDIIRWLGTQGALSATGTLVISQTGDVIQIDHSYR